MIIHDSGCTMLYDLSFDIRSILLYVNQICIFQMCLIIIIGILTI